MQPAAPISPPSCRIVVAEDDRDVADSIALLLRLEGHEVVVATDGEGALKAIKAIQPHVALLDIGLPGLDGYEVVRRLRREGYLSLTLVAVTGWGQPTDKARAFAAGFNLHYTKPVDPQTILALCTQIAAGA